MTDCKWCGSARHHPNNCPTRNLIASLLGDEVAPDAPMPDFVSIMDADKLLSKTEEELHDEVKALHHLKDTNEELKK